MANKKSKTPPPTEKINTIPVLLDTSVLLAYANEKDPHHITVASALGAIRPYKPIILIANVVLMEAMGKLIKRTNCTVASAEKALRKKLNDFDARHEVIQMNRDYILGRYRQYAKGELHTLGGIDFYIAVEAISTDGVLLTCDVEMHEKTKKRHFKTYLLTAEKSELNKLLKDLSTPGKLVVPWG